MLLQTPLYTRGVLLSRTMRRPDELVRGLAVFVCITAQAFVRVNGFKVWAFTSVAADYDGEEPQTAFHLRDCFVLSQMQE